MATVGIQCAEVVHKPYSMLAYQNVISKCMVDGEAGASACIFL
jgi:hypothetical protein